MPGINGGQRTKREALVAAFFLLLSLGLLALPTGYEVRQDRDALRAKASVLAVDDSQVFRQGIVITGDQGLTLRLKDGPFAGREVRANNPLLGKMDLDTVFAPGDTALAVLTMGPGNEILHVGVQSHYRLDLELALFGLFALLLAAFGGLTGIKALLSFVFSGICLWKVLVPLMLDGVPPVPLTLATVAGLTAAIVLLVAGPTRLGLTAFLGAILGVGTSGVLAWVFTREFHITGAVLPFAETLLYSGYQHLDLRAIFTAAVFLAASGAVMDLAMDVAASQAELKAAHPEVSRARLLRAGLSVGRAVVGTMTTTLLLAYSGGYLTLLMAFMAQGVPLANLANLVFVAAEILKTLVGSFGLVAVAPFTAVAGAFIMGRGSEHTG